MPCFLFVVKYLQKKLNFLFEFKTKLFQNKFCKILMTITCYFQCIKYIKSLFFNEYSNSYET